MEASELIDLRRIYAGPSIHCHRIRVWEQDGNSIRFAARGNSCNMGGRRIDINIGRAFPVTPPSHQLVNLITKLQLGLRMAGKKARQLFAFFDWI